MAGTIYLKSSQAQVGEQAGTHLVTIARSGPTTGEVVITWGLTGDGAATGLDVVGGTGSVTMPGGAAEVMVPVTILDDGLAEGTESVVFSVVQVQGAALGAPRTERIAILDDEDLAPPPDPEPPLVSDYAVGREVVVAGLERPIRFLFSPLDVDRVLVAEQGGVVRLADIGTGTTQVLLDISGQVNAWGDRGLLDVALHPDFPANPYLYVFAVIDPPETAGEGPGPAA